MYKYAALFDGKIWAVSYDLIELFFMAATNLLSSGIPINPFDVEIVPAHYSLGVGSDFTINEGVLE